MCKPSVSNSLPINYNFVTSNGKVSWPRVDGESNFIEFGLR